VLLREKIGFSKNKRIVFKKDFINRMVDDERLLRRFLSDPKRELKVAGFEVTNEEIADIKMWIEDYKRKGILENMMNKQQQLIQTLSNIMKNVHDTSKAIVRNMR
jgi:hypothetical protein